MMSKDKRTLEERLQELADMLGRWLNASAPAPAPKPVPVRNEGPKRTTRR